MNTQASQPRKMLANFHTKTFIPLPDDEQQVNVSRLVQMIKDAGASLSYPSLLKLIRGAVDSVGGFELIKVEHYTPVYYKNITRPVLHRETTRVPVPVVKGSTQDNILTMLVKGVHSKELMTKFPQATSDVQVLNDLQHYANAFGYDVNYDSQDQVVQLVLPIGMDNIKYTEPVDPASIVGDALM